MWFLRGYNNNESKSPLAINNYINKSVVAAIKSTIKNLAVPADNFNNNFSRDFKHFQKMWSKEFVKSGNCFFNYLSKLLAHKAINWLFVRQSIITINLYDNILWRIAVKHWTKTQIVSIFYNW